MLLRPIKHTGRATARAGFTLMELLVVVAILVILVGVATPMYLSYLEQSKARTAKTAAKMYAGYLSQFAISHDGNFPPDNNWDPLPLQETQKPPLDPWGRPYQFLIRDVTQADGMQHRDPIVWSSGPAGAEGPEGQYSSMSR